MSGGRSSQLAERIVRAFDRRELMGLLSEGDPELDAERAYEIAAAVQDIRARRGETPIGRKIGFTNRNTWPQYGVRAPIWGPVYDSTVSRAREGFAEVDVGEMIQPRIEPEIQLHFSATPPATDDEDEILACIDWIAQGFEIVQCPFAEWRFQAVDAIAAYAVHGALILGTPVPVADVRDCREKLRRFTITLHRDGRPVATGGGANVLDSPIRAFAHLAAELHAQTRFPPVQAGEVVTTGTLTDLYPALPGDTWSTTLEGIELPGMTLHLI